MTVGWDAFTVSTWSDRTFVKRFLFENYIQIFQKKKQIFIKTNFHQKKTDRFENFEYRLT